MTQGHWRGATARDDSVVKRREEMGWSRRQRGLTYYDPGRAYRGYTLFAPNGGDHAYLIDMEGSIVHQWLYAPGIGECHLLPDGHLLLRSARSLGSGGFASAPSSDHLLELDWNWETAWEYRNPRLLSGVNYRTSSKNLNNYSSIIGATQ